MFIFRKKKIWFLFFFLFLLFWFRFRFFFFALSFLVLGLGFGLGFCVPFRYRRRCHLHLTFVFFSFCVLCFVFFLLHAVSVIQTLKPERAVVARDLKDHLVSTAVAHSFQAVVFSRFPVFRSEKRVHLNMNQAFFPLAKDIPL